MPTADVPWDLLDSAPGRSIFCTRAWLQYLEQSQHVTPVVARVVVDGTHRGWFTGGLIRRAGLRLLGAPLPGWGTSYMGLEWSDPPVDPSFLPRVAAAVRTWAIRSLGCVHVETLVRTSPRSFDPPTGVTCGVFQSYRRALVGDSEMWGAMSTNARRNLRRGRERGVTVEVVGFDGALEFVEVCYRQISQAFARRGTRPSYPLTRLIQLVNSVFPSGQLLMLRAVDLRGRTAATNISAGLPGGLAVFLMGAGDPDLLDVRPNEAVMWEAMRRWRDQGAVEFDFGGGGAYKAKFGAEPIESAWLRSSLVPGSEALRTWARRVEARRRATSHRRSLPY